MIRCSFVSWLLFLFFLNYVTTCAEEVPAREKHYYDPLRVLLPDKAIGRPKVFSRDQSHYIASTALSLDEHGATMTYTSDVVKINGEEWYSWRASDPSGTKPHSVTFRANAEGRTPLEISQLLYHAAFNGKLEEVEHYAKLGGNVNVRNEGDGATSLHASAFQGNLDVVKFIVDSGANVNARMHDGATPLYAAAQCGHTEIVKFLAANGADPNAVRTSGWSPIQIAAQNGRKDVVQFLLDFGVEIDRRNNDGVTALLSASIAGHLDVVRLLLQYGANANLTSPGNHGVAPIHEAVSSGHLEVVKALVEEGNADINAETTHPQRWVPLTLAKYNEHNDIVEYLESLGARRPRGAWFSTGVQIVLGVLAIGYACFSSRKSVDGGSKKKRKNPSKPLPRRRHGK